MSEVDVGAKRSDAQCKPSGDTDCASLAGCRRSGLLFGFSNTFGAFCAVLPVQGDEQSRAQTAFPPLDLHLLPMSLALTL